MNIRPVGFYLSPAKSQGKKACPALALPSWLIRSFDKYLFSASHVVPNYKRKHKERKAVPSHWAYIWEKRGLFKSISVIVWQYLHAATLPREADSKLQPPHLLTGQVSKSSPAAFCSKSLFLVNSLSSDVNESPGLSIISVFPLSKLLAAPFFPGLDISTVMGDFPDVHLSQTLTTRAIMKNIPKQLFVPMWFLHEGTREVKQFLTFCS